MVENKTVGYFVAEREQEPLQLQQNCFSQMGQILKTKEILFQGNIKKISCCKLIAGEVLRQTFMAGSHDKEINSTSKEIPVYFTYRQLNWLKLSKYLEALLPI